MFSVDEQIQQAMLDRTKKALQSALLQIESLFGHLEPHMDAELLQQLKDNFEAQLKRDLGGE